MSPYCKLSGPSSTEFNEVSSTALDTIFDVKDKEEWASLFTILYGDLYDSTICINEKLYVSMRRSSFLLGTSI